MEKYTGSMKDKLENIKIEVDMKSNDHLIYGLTIVANLEERLIGIKDIKIKLSKEQKNAALYYKLNSKGEKLLRDMINLE